MQLTTFFALALTTATAFAVPASSIEKRVAISDVNKRADTGVYLCNDRNFEGYCVHIDSPSGTCVPLGGDLNDKISAAGPDQGSFCYFFVNPGCDTNADFFHVGYPGYGDLSVTPVNGPAGSTRNFEDKLSSYRCTTE
ncbi:hypothetical protein BDV96DRAFT_556608 [Lophiotrema nucula]|uniref:Beta/gamma crystallin 'Greek key' domain-containing protein n=1 Tax=Lophiotrema nucula TaxID=690887 RepID=A0A6A5YM19_9PLEO|nr:hypothetical protein BDV96DRAFT_556608 [Lophiotrema nucula]